MEGINSLLCLLVGLKVDEAETLALALVIDLDDSGRDVAKLLEEFDEIVLSNVGIEVLDVDVGEVGADLVKLGLALL